MRSTWVVLTMGLLLSACGGEDVPPANPANNNTGDLEEDTDGQGDADTDAPDADADTDVTPDVAPDADEDGADLPDACPQGQERCDGDCVDVATDLLHCGGCGMACDAPPNAQAACQERACVYTCEAGFADPNGDLNDRGGDGCECDRAPEVCDGADNDCDNLLDEEDGAPLCDARPQAEVTCAGAQGCVYTCPSGRVDANGDLADSGGDGCECVPSQDPAEACDGVDNDCDGAVDEDDTQRCPALTGASASACNQGVCLYACTPGALDLNDDLNTPGSDGCEYACTPSSPNTELCDGADNDCDGVTDNGGDALCQTLDNANASCAGDDGCRYTCLGAFVDVNDDLGQPGSNGCECLPTADPAEICDGVDNDCDGAIDQADTDSYQPALCALQTGACMGATQRCLLGAPVPCDVGDYAVHDASFSGLPDSLELDCDGADNNCDGDIDDLCCAPNMATPRPLLAPAMPNTAQLVPRVFHTNMPNLLLLTWQESLISERDQLTTSGYVRWALFNTDTLSVQLHGLQSGDAEDYQATATWDGVGYALAWVNDSVDDSISWSRYNQQGQVDRSRNGLFQGDGNTIRNPVLIGLGEGRSALFWLDSECATQGATSCLKRAELAANGVPGPATELVAAPNTTLQNLLFVPGDSPEAGWMLWQQRPSSGAPSLRWASVTPGAVLNTTNIGAQTYAQSLSAPAAAHHDGGLMLVFQDHDGQRAQLYSLDIDPDGVPRSAPAPLTSNTSEHLFPALAAFDGRFALSWVERITPTRYALNFMHLEQDGSPASPPVPRFEALGLHYQPVALHTLNPYGVLSFVSTNNTPFAQRMEWSLLNVDGDALCVEP